MKHEFNIFREIEKYDMLIKQHNATMYEGGNSIRKHVLLIEEELTKMDKELCPCHNDAVPENFIKTKDGRIFLIDWEYSGKNDPMADIAALFLESSFTIENQDRFLDLYFDGIIPPSSRTKIKYYQILWDFLWAQWTIIKEARGDHFGTYGKDRYYRGIHNLRSTKYS